MGRKRPHSDTTECITRSDGAQDSQIHVFFEVPINLFCDFKGVIDLDTKIPHRALNSLVAQKQLRRAEVPSAAVDQSHLRPPHAVRRKFQTVETDTAHPF